MAPLRATKAETTGITGEVYGDHDDDESGLRTDILFQLR